MSTSKHDAVAATLASTLAAIIGQLGAPSLAADERKRLRKRNENVPDALVDMVIHLADENAGHVLGMPYDTHEARAALAEVSALRTAIAVARQLLQRLEDESVQRRIAVADPTFALYTALRRLVNTPAGNALKPAYSQMQSIVKNRPRKSRSKKAAPPAQPSPKTGA
jgi:hypothetical protein